MNNDLFVAIAADVDETGISLTIPGQGTTQKHYKRLSSASISGGDIVLCAQVSGTYLVLGKITA